MVESWPGGDRSFEGTEQSAEFFKRARRSGSFAESFEIKGEIVKRRSRRDQENLEEEERIQQRMEAVERF